MFYYDLEKIITTTLASNEYDTDEKEITKSATVEYYEGSEIPKKPTINKDFSDYGKPRNRENYLHGGDLHEKFGGTCDEFLRLNGLEKCCSSQDDECYMIHYDTRCYCDVFCHRNTSSDCCPDGAFTCRNIEVKSTTPSEINFDHSTFGVTYRTGSFDNYEYIDGRKEHLIVIFINSKNFRNL